MLDNPRGMNFSATGIVPQAVDNYDVIFASCIVWTTLCVIFAAGPVNSYSFCGRYIAIHFLDPPCIPCTGTFQLQR